MFGFHYMWVAISLSAIFLAEAASGAPTYVFTDEAAHIAVPEAPPEVACAIRTITPVGWGPERAITGKVRDGVLEISPLVEGLHLVNIALPTPIEVRFLAIAPPPELDKQVLRKALPQSGDRLLDGKPFKILSMGDSVTHTGDYETLLAMMLSRATGNRNISLVDRSYPGRSIDASVRNFQADIATKPNLALVMYGLNDQAVGASLAGYLEQYTWLATHLTQACGADTVFLQPTPHIDIFEGTENASVNPPEYAFRTIGFAKSLSLLAKNLNHPCAETFGAIWGEGGKTIEDSAKKLWPLYPLSYNVPFSSLIESTGKGDTIHPNVLGHLMIAKAVYQAIARPRPQVAPAIHATSFWTDAGVKSTITLTNPSDRIFSGELAVYPRHECGPLELARTNHRGSGSFRLQPGETCKFEVVWPEARHPRDLLDFPAIACLAPGNPILAVVLHSDGGTTVSGVPAPFDAPTFVRERRVVTSPRMDARLDNGESMEIEWSPDQDNGRIPLILKTEIGWAVAELAYCRHAAALNGDAVLDAEDTEWGDHAWARVGAAFQARGMDGHREDRRTDPDECDLAWACKAGVQGITFCIRAEGSVENDDFVLFFDPRTPEQLGTPGRYYWVSGSLRNDGTLALAKGETSARDSGLAGRWKKSAGGAVLEFFVPFELMEIDSWPESGDLGFSFWWKHHGAGGTTNLMWSEDGHPWSPRWYGVIRLVGKSDQDLPWRVRIK